MSNDQTMQLSDSLFPSLVSGWKQCTIRAGKRDIEPGLLTFISAIDPERTHLCYVHRVSFVRFGDLTLADAQKDNATTVEELQSVLKQYYPTLTDKDIVTIVEFS